MISVKTRLDTIKIKINVLKDEAKVIKQLVEKFPDLEIHFNRWKHERYTSAAVNAEVTHVDIGYNCGCCEDKPVEVWPYVEHNGVKIFSKPASFMVGERNSSTGRDWAYEDWQKGLRSMNISEKVIKIIEDYFAAEEANIDREYYDETDDE